MKVLKFGGTSIRDADRIQHVVKILKDRIRDDEIAVVVSAFGGITDLLLKTAEQAVLSNKAYEKQFQEIKDRHLEVIHTLFSGKALDDTLKITEKYTSRLWDILHGVYLVRDLAPKSYNQILSYGERLSARIISAYLTSQGIQAEYIDARKVVKTDSNYNAAAVNFRKTNSRIKNRYAKKTGMWVMTGFIATNDLGETTVLGRSGSDYSAAILGAAVDATEVEIWTDVNGVMTANPRMVQNATTIPSMSYADALEMSHFGAKVIYPPTVQPLMKKDIPIRIKNTFEPDFEGTLIGNLPPDPDHKITGISSIEEISLIRMSGSGMIGRTGFNGRIFQSVARRDVGVMLISLASSEQSICFAVSPESAGDAKSALEEEFAWEIRNEYVSRILIEDNLAIVAVVGENMRHTPGISGKVFSALGEQGINVIAIAQGSSERNISIVISADDEVQAIQTLHKTFFD